MVQSWGSSGAAGWQENMSNSTVAGVGTPRSAAFSRTVTTPWPAPGRGPAWASPSWVQHPHTTHRSLELETKFPNILQYSLAALTVTGDVSHLQLLLVVSIAVSCAGVVFSHIIETVRSIFITNIILSVLSLGVQALVLVWVSARKVSSHLIHIVQSHAWHTASVVVNDHIMTARNKQQARICRFLNSLQASIKAASRNATLINPGLLLCHQTSLDISTSWTPFNILWVRSENVVFRKWKSPKCQ